MKYILLFISTFFIYPIYLRAQTINDQSIRVGAAFLLLPTDAKSAALGSTGAATRPDLNSSYWNIAKTAFLENATPYGLALNFTPILANIKGKVSNSYLNAVFQLTNNKTLTTSFNYFTTGNVILTDDIGNSLGNFTPNEYAFSLGYAQCFSPNWSIGIGFRYIQSNLLNISIGFGQNSSGQAFASDVGIYYQNKTDLDKQWAFGLMLSNIGTKLNFEDTRENQSYFIPMNLRIGTQYSLRSDDKTVFHFSLDLNKLLVPTPPEIDAQKKITKGKNPDISTFQALYQSFYDAPRGLPEELKEIQYGLGISWEIDSRYALRVGANYQHPNKGQNRFLSSGLGYNLQNFDFNIAYLFSYDQQGNQNRSNTFVAGISWRF